MVRGRRALAALAVAALVAACSDDGADDPAGDAGSTTTSTTEAPADAPGSPTVLGPDEDLYALAAGELTPGEPGELIAVQPVPGVLDGADVWRVLHWSASLEGDPVPVSGLVAAPAGAAPDGERTVVSWAHGTTGIADECAPSRDPVRLAGLALAAPLIERDMVVTFTDYEGLGTPGRHPYLVGESEARGVLDIVRAAQHLEVGAGDRVVIWGHSQGGHAALFANEVAEDWAPDLEVLGTIAVAPPSQLPVLARLDLRGNQLKHFVGMILATWPEAYPDADPADVAVPEALDSLDQVDEGCFPQVAAAWQATLDEPLLREGALETPPWPDLVEANEPGRRPGASPVLIVHGDDDSLIPAASSALLVDQMCAAGATVHRRTYPGADHSSVLAAAAADTAAWIDARTAGQAAPDDCADGADGGGAG